VNQIINHSDQQGLLFVMVVQVYLLNHGSDGNLRPEVLKLDLLDLSVNRVAIW
jgi:hypothetical protein